MLIKSVRSIEFIQHIDSPGWALITGAIPRPPTVILVIEAADGTEGYGTISALSPQEMPPAAITACIDFLKGAIVGKEVNVNARMADVERALWRNAEIKCAFEVALYDLASRLRGMSLSDYLGGRIHDKIPVIRLVSLQAPERMADFAAELVAKGYTALKLKWSGDVKLDVARVKAVRERVGPNIRMTVDANCRYEVKSAIRAIEESADYGVELVEQPVPRGNREGMALITRTVRPMVEADESAQNYDEILDLVRHRVVDCINLRLSRLGGIKAVMDAARVCESGDIKYRFGLMLMPSHFQAATLHVASVLPYLPVGHEIGEHELFREDLFEPLSIVNGMATVPDGPGVGPRLRSAAR
jgi:L-alanine-DL-glutamate epimerase-like enolase superfamily enzyme